MRVRIDCCYQCERPNKSPYCHADCPVYIGQRAELDEHKKAINLKSITAANVYWQRSDGVARATRKSNV